MPPRRLQSVWRARRATTLVELTVVLVTIGVLLGIIVPALQASMARHAVSAATRDIAGLLSMARQIAATSIDGAAVAFDTAGGRVRLDVSGRVVRTLDVAGRHGVRMQATRDSLAYDSRGLGIGAANLSVILTRRQAADTVVISRLGRVRH